MKTDTIAAIATAISDSGIGIIRISGPEAVEVADRVYQNRNRQRSLRSYKSHTIHYGFIVEDEKIVDEVMISVMLSPKSYTTEDTVEINCHGGVLLMQRILHTVLKNGARIAEPGEFTKRAFLNGRIDLTKAEAVMDLIRSKNDYALKASVKQLEGSVESEIKSLRAAILHEIAFIESALDDPEHISIDGYKDRLSEQAEQLTERMKELLKSADNGRLRKEGIQTVILGKPNAGKSSLLNLLVGEEKAIVTNIAGTTRDVIEESISLDGIGLNIIDTAGIRSTEDFVEKIGVEKAKQYARDADLIVYVLDTSVPLDENDNKIMKLAGNKKTVIILNKTDLPSVVSEHELDGWINENGGKTRPVRMSVKEGTGLRDFISVVKELFFAGVITSDDEVVITNMRHKEAIRDAADSLELVQKSLADGMPEDFYSIDLMNAYKALGQVTGEEVGDDLVNEIFSSFCMGK